MPYCIWQEGRRTFLLLRFLDILRLLRIKIQPKARITKRQYVAIIDLFPFFRRFPVYHDLCMPQRRNVRLPSCHIQYGMALDVYKRQTDAYHHAGHVVHALGMRDIKALHAVRHAG